MPPRRQPRWTADEPLEVGRVPNGVATQWKISPTPGNILTEQDLQEAVAAIGANYNRGAMLQTAAHYAETGEYVRSKAFPLGAEARFAPAAMWWDSTGNMHVEWDGDIDHVMLFVRPGRAGGASEHNDCLFECIYDYFAGTRYGMTLCNGPRDAAGLKKMLGLERDDMVPLSMLPAVGKAYGLSIDVTGDSLFEYKNPERTTWLMLAFEDGHFRALHAKHAYKPRLMWEWRKDGKANTCCDGKVTVIPGEAMRAILCETGQDAKFVCRIAKPTHWKNSKSLLEQWKDWQAEHGVLLKEGVDVFKTTTYAKAALRELAMLSGNNNWKYIPVDQQAVIARASVGALIWAQKGYGSDEKCEAKGAEFHQYDFNSYYGAVMIEHQFPNAPGKFETWPAKSMRTDGAKKYWPYGIYRLAKCLPNPPAGTCPQWVSTYTGHCTHVDLQMYYDATGIEPELAQDGKPNALIWTGKERCNGKQTFGPHMKKWYELKKKGVAGSKEMIAVLWGTLSQHNHKPRYVKRGASIPWYEEIWPAGPDAYHIKFRPTIDLYSGLAPALGCFVLAFARQKIVAAMKGRSDVVRVHTDSFTLKKPLAANDPRIGLEMGQLKPEHDTATGIVIRNVNCVDYIGCKCKKCAAKPKRVPKPAAAPKPASKPRPAPKPATTKLDAMAAFLAASE